MSMKIKLSFLLMCFALTHLSLAQNSKVGASFVQNYVDLRVKADTIVLTSDDLTYCNYDFILPPLEGLKNSACFAVLGGKDAGYFKLKLNNGKFIYAFGENDNKRVSLKRDPFQAVQDGYTFDLKILKPAYRKDDTIFRKTLVYRKISSNEMFFSRYYQDFYKKSFNENKDFEYLFQDTIPLPISMDSLLFVYSAFYDGPLFSFSFPEGVELDKTHMCIMEGDGAFDFRALVENNILNIGRGGIIFDPNVQDLFTFDLCLYELDENKDPSALLTRKKIVIRIVGEGEDE